VRTELSFWPDLGERWPSRLVATAAADCLSKSRDRSQRHWAALSPSKKLGNGAVQRARPATTPASGLANLYCNINNIRVRSFILTGAPRYQYVRSEMTGCVQQMSNIREWTPLDARLVPALRLMSQSSSRVRFRANRTLEPTSPNDRV
jgi:hypothetical protein